MQHHAGRHAARPLTEPGQKMSRLFLWGNVSARSEAGAQAGTLVAEKFPARARACEASVDGACKAGLLWSRRVPLPAVSVAEAKKKASQSLECARVWKEDAARSCCRAAMTFSPGLYCLQALRSRRLCARGEGQSVVTITVRRGRRLTRPVRPETRWTVQKNAFQPGRRSGAECAFVPFSYPVFACAGRDAAYKPGSVAFAVVRA